MERKQIEDFTIIIDGITDVGKIILNNISGNAKKLLNMLLPSELPDDIGMEKLEKFSFTWDGETKKAEYTLKIEIGASVIGYYIFKNRKKRYASLQLVSSNVVNIDKMDEVVFHIRQFLNNFS